MALNVDDEMHKRINQLMQNRRIVWQRRPISDDFVT